MFGSKPTLLVHDDEVVAGEAVSTTGRPYSDLPSAFSYRKQFNPSCSCKAAGRGLPICSERFQIHVIPLLNRREADDAAPPKMGCEKPGKHEDAQVEEE